MEIDDYDIVVLLVLDKKSNKKSNAFLDGLWVLGNFTLKLKSIRGLLII